MAQGRVVLPRVDIGSRPMQPLQEDRTNPEGSGQSNLRPMPSDRNPVVPERLGSAPVNGTDKPAYTLHIAIVVKDLKLFDSVRQNVYLVKPPYWKGRVELHVLVQKPGSSPEDMTYRLALSDLGMADPTVLGLNDGLQLSMGWPDAESSQPKTTR